MLDSIPSAIAAIRAGQLVIVVDDEHRENEGDLVGAAELITPQSVNFMATHGRGLICCPITAERAAELALPLMVQDNTCPFKTAFTVSVDAIKDTTTGISAFERALTLQRLSDPACGSGDFMRPGHIFPLIAKDGGVLERRGQTEASVDLARLAGLKPAGVICEILNEDGTMARLPQLRIFADRWGLKLISIEDLSQYIRSIQRKDSP